MTATATASPAFLEALCASNALGHTPGARWLCLSKLACLSKSHSDTVQHWRSGLVEVSLEGGAVAASCIHTVAKQSSQIQTLHLSRRGTLNDTCEAAGMRIFYLRDGDERGAASIKDDAILALAQACPLLTSLDLGGCTGLRAAALAQLSTSLPKLSSLDLSKCDDMFSHLCPEPSELALLAGCLTSLTSLDLSSCGHGVRDGGLIALYGKCRHLATLRLAYAWQITDIGLLHLAGRPPNLPQLRATHERLGIDPACPPPPLPLVTLDLYGCNRLSEDGALAIISPRLVRLHLSSTACATSSVLYAIASTCSRLAVLKLMSCRLHEETITTAFAAVAKSCPQLSEVDLSSSGALPNIVQGLAEAIGARLTALHLFECVQVDNDVVFSVAAHCPNLTLLDVSFCFEIGSDAIVALIAACRKLASLCLVGCRCVAHDAICAALRLQGGLPMLRRLDVQGCSLSGRDGAYAIVRALAECCPAICRLAIDGFDGCEGDPETMYAMLSEAASPELEVMVPRPSPSVDDDLGLFVDVWVRRRRQGRTRVDRVCADRT